MLVSLRKSPHTAKSNHTSNAGLSFAHWLRNSDTRWKMATVPCRRLWKLPWSPPRCLCLSSSSPSWSGTRESRWYRCLCGQANRTFAPLRTNCMLVYNFPWMWILTVGIHLVNHVLKLSLGGILPQGAHHGPELFGGDGTVAVFIKQRERLLELCKGSVGALVSGDKKHTF